MASWLEFSRAGGRARESATPLPERMLAAGAPLRVVVADTHCLFREGLASLLAECPGVEILAVTADAEETVVAARRLLPDLVLMGCHLSRADALAATRRVGEVHEGLKVVLLSAARSRPFLAEAARAGASGVLSDAVDLAELARVLEAFRRDEAVSSRHYVPLPHGDGGHRPAGRASLALTEQESRVLALLLEGRSNGEIAAGLGIRRDTVKAHLKHVFRKLGVRSRTEAVVVGLRWGMRAQHGTAAAGAGASEGMERKG